MGLGVMGCDVFPQVTAPIGTFAEVSGPPDRNYDI